jgi:hypothetical protein
MMRSSHQPRRPGSVTLLAFGVLIVASLNLVRGIEALLQWQFLAGLLVVSPLYLVLSGLTWGSTGLPLVWGLWRGLGWASWGTGVYVLAYALYYWIDRLWVATSGLGANWPFTSGMTAILLLYVFGVLLRRKSREFFTR